MSLPSNPGCRGSLDATTETMDEACTRCNQRKICRRNVTSESGHMTCKSRKQTNLRTNMSHIHFESDTLFCNNILLHIAKYYLLDFTIPFIPLPHFVYGGVLDINIVVVYLPDYISARVHYSRLHSTIVPSVACQTTEGKYHSY